jgi:phospholipase/carboxylesterase
MFLKNLILLVMTISQIQFNYAKGDTLLLHYVMRKPKIIIENPPLLILLHGLGGNENDLFSFANLLPNSFLIISARAPFEITKGSYKWFEVNFNTGKPVIDAEQAEKSRIVLVQFIQQLKEKLNFSNKEVYLCGFSQGAIMALSVGLTRPEKVKGVIALSGRVLKEMMPKIASKEKLANLKMLIIHGKADNILPIHYALESKKLLEALNIKNRYIELETGHSVTNQTIKLIDNWLRKVEIEK